MFEILRKSFATGVVTTSYPQTPAEVSGHARGRPEIAFANWKDARPAAAVCPTGAIACAERKGTRAATLDLGKCIFCGLCAEADQAIHMTTDCELAAWRREDLITVAEYQLQADGTQNKLMSPVASERSAPALRAHELPTPRSSRREEALTSSPSPRHQKLE